MCTTVVELVGRNFKLSYGIRLPSGFIFGDYVIFSANQLDFQDLPTRTDRWLLESLLSNSFPVINFVVNFVLGCLVEGFV